MTVSELIERLSKFSGDREVCYTDYEWGLTHVGAVEQLTEAEDDLPIGTVVINAGED